MRVVHNKLCRLVLLLLLAVASRAAAFPPPSAQQTGMEGIAARLASQLAKEHLRTVAVARLTTEKNGGSYALSIWVSNQLATALASDPKGLKALHRSDLLPILKRSNLLPIDMGLPQVFRRAAREAGAQAVVEGTLEQNGDSFAIAVRASNLAAGRTVAEAEGVVAETQAVAELRDTPARDSASGVFLPGIGGVSYPKCLHCANPQLTCEKNSAIVLLLAFTVTTQGTVGDVGVVSGAGIPLDKIALEAVHRWQFVPAQLPDGAPVPSRMASQFACRIASNP